VGVTIEGFQERSHVVLTTFLIAICITISSTAFSSLASPTHDVEPLVPGQPLGPVPILSIELGPEVLWAKVSEDSSGIVTFEGTVNVEMSRAVNGRVTLQHDLVDEDWAANVEPQTMEFRGPGSETFVLSVIVPPGALADAPVDVSVTGYLKVPGLAPSVASASVVVAVEHYFDVEITSREPVVSVRRGETGNVLLNFTNRGNADLEVTMYVEGDHEGVDFEFTGEPYLVGPGESTDIIARARVGSDAPRGDARVTVFFQCDPTSSGATRSVITFDITVNVPTLVQRMGVAGVASILIIVAVVGVGMYVGWRKGKLTRISGIKEWLLRKKATD